MNKKGIIFYTLIISLILLVSVYAEGTSDGGTRSDNKTIRNNTLEKTPLKQKLMQEYRSMVKTKLTDGTCDDLDTQRERIKCRLVLASEYKPKVNLIPEGCRRLASPEACKRLYRESAGCYELRGKEKNACFRRISGFIKEKINDETENKTNKTRNYVVLLLYDLQERVEEAQAENKITEDEATDLVNKITEIKQDILDGKKKDEIRKRLVELKQMWRSSIV